jgi:hypothetical protein
MDIDALGNQQLWFDYFFTFRLWASLQDKRRFRLEEEKWVIGTLVAQFRDMVPGHGERLGSSQNREDSGGEERYA